QAVGLIDYDVRWHVGDRFTVLSNGGLDFFDQGLRAVTVGAELSRPPRGRLFLGFRSLEGPFSSNVILSRFDYWMSPKWISSYNTQLDLSNPANVGHNFSLTR